MMLMIFFALVFAVLIGLILLAINVQPVLEKIFVYIFLFWEKKSMRAVLNKNLVSHKEKNMLTAVIYALSLGSVIFLLTSLNLQIDNIFSYTNVADSDLEVKVNWP